ncbi:MAG TPA: Hsp20/alpha crystallin family protein [bacterium]|nr:Hsp20/alpha crystallin family protein [bacterium]
MLMRRSFFPAPAPAFDRSLDRLFRDVFDGFGPFDSDATSGRGIAVNARETDEGFLVEAELPGFEEKNVDVTVLGKEVRIEARHEESDSGTDGKVLRRERWTGSVARSLRFPVEIENGKVEARFANGVLHVTLPKAKTALPRKIEIRG